MTHMYKDTNVATSMYTVVIKCIPNEFTSFLETTQTQNSLQDAYLLDALFDSP